MRLSCSAPGVARSRRGRATIVVGLLLVSSLATQLPGVASAATESCIPEVGWGVPQPTWAADVLRLTNAHRASIGLGAVSTSATLTAAAEWKAAHMAHLGYMEHDDPDGRDWYQRLNDCGYTHGAAENIAYGYKTAAKVFEGWLNSPGHRKNIEDPDYEAIGIGAAVNDEGRPYWVQDFGTRVDMDIVPIVPTPALPALPQPQPTSLPPEPQPMASVPSLEILEPADGEDTVVARNDAVTVVEDGSLVIDVLVNDEVNGDAGSLVSFIGADHGGVTWLGDSFLYVPDPNFHGSDSFTYRLGSPTTPSTATVSIEVRPVNDAPVAEDDRLRVSPSREASIGVLSNDLDVDGDALAIRIRLGGLFGRARVNEANGSITYRAGRGFGGMTELITYAIDDGEGGVDLGVVKIRIRRA